MKQRYEEIADVLRARIVGGVYGDGGQLPSRRELGEEFEVSDTVADKAMMILRLEGWTQTRAGVGVFVAARRRPRRRQ